MIEGRGVGGGFGGLPEIFEFVEGHVAELLPVGERVLFHVAEAAVELRVRIAHRAFGIDIQLARKIDNRKEHVTKLLTHVHIFMHELAGLKLRIGKFAQFFGELLRDLTRIAPVEADTRRLLLQLLPTL